MEKIKYHTIFIFLFYWLNRNSENYINNVLKFINSI